MRGKRTSDRIKQNIAESALKLATNKKVPVVEVPINQIARRSRVAWGTVKKIMTEEDFTKFVSIKKQELTIAYSDILFKQLDSIQDDLTNGRFKEVNPISKYTAYGIVIDKWLQLVGKDSPRMTFSQNTFNVSQAITDLLANKKNDQQNTNRQGGKGKIGQRSYQRCLRQG